MRRSYSRVGSGRVRVQAVSEITMKHSLDSNRSSDHFVPPQRIHASHDGLLDTDEVSNHLIARRVEKLSASKSTVHRKAPP